MKIHTEDYWIKWILASRDTHNCTLTGSRISQGSLAENTRTRDDNTNEGVFQTLETK